MSNFVKYYEIGSYGEVRNCYFRSLPFEVVLFGVMLFRVETCNQKPLFQTKNVKNAYFLKSGFVHNQVVA